MNYWFPIFGRKIKGNGTMLMRRGSHHRRDFDFIYYMGYDKESIGEPNRLRQYEIPEYQLGEFETVPIDANRGDLVAFHKDLVHSSSINQTNAATFHTGIRIWDMCNDLTLSANLATAPHLDDLGRPGLMPLNVES